jgi:hypothetical protein
MPDFKQTLDDAGVSERLKGFEVFSHVSGSSVIFELVMDSSKVIAADAKTMAAIREEATNLRKQVMARVTKSFELGPEGPRRVVRDARRMQSDARSSPRDARRGARDARRGAAMDRILENPRGMEMTPEGKLSVTLERSATTGKTGFKIPKGAFQGILGDFMDRLNGVVADNFSGELQNILSRHLK